jgi:uncharacterized RDD family membrane protein YckC
MKCPKCNYLGFETGDRCKHCGYDFSLTPLDLALNVDPPGSPAHAASIGDVVLDPAFDRARVASPSTHRHSPPPSTNLQSNGAQGLPLFSPPGGDDDEPLVKLPLAPRAPLAVRRTADVPRPRAVAKAPRPQPEPVLQFLDDQPSAPAVAPPADHGGAPVILRANAAAVALDPSGAGRRMIAAAIDVIILLAIDAAVIYFTLRMAALSLSEWTMLPPVPLIAFLLLLKLGYVSAFTAVGGQTIGKMAAGIRVVTHDNRALDPTCALRRTLAGLVSWLTLGAGFLPALVNADRRALHDRLAHTRVVTLPS